MYLSCRLSAGSRRSTAIQESLGLTLQDLRLAYAKTVRVPGLFGPEHTVHKRYLPSETGVSSIGSASWHHVDEVGKQQTPQQLSTKPSTEADWPDTHPRTAVSMFSFGKMTHRLYRARGPDLRSRSLAARPWIPQASLDLHQCAQSLIVIIIS